MRLTSYTDFGLRALLYLATLPEGELSSVAKVSALYDVLNAFLAVMDSYTLQDLLANRDELQKVFGELIPTLVLEPDEESE